MFSNQTITPGLETKIKSLWTNNNLALKIPLIDLQHVWLLFLIIQSEDIVQLNGTGLKYDDVREIFLELSEYIVEHFDIEEKLFEIFGYPDAREHKDHHDKFIREFQRIHKQCSQGEVDSIQKLVPFLNNWLLKHIVREDRLYLSYFNQIGPKIAAALQKIISDKHVTIKPLQTDLYKLVMKDGAALEATHKDIVERIYSMASKFKISIHVPIVDIQHLWLLKLMLELEVAGQTFPTNQKKFFFERTVKLLQEYTKEHFFTEELIMQEFKYPDYERHCVEHKNFLQRLMVRVGQHKAGEALATSELTKDLKEWIFSHIAMEDKKMGIYLAKRHRQVSDFVKSQIYSKKLILRRSQVHLYNEVNGIKDNRHNK